MPLPLHIYQAAAKGDQDSLAIIKKFEKEEKRSAIIFVITLCLALLLLFFPWDVVFFGPHEKTTPNVAGEMMTVCSQGLLFSSCREITIYRKGE